MSTLLELNFEKRPLPNLYSDSPTKDNMLVVGPDIYHSAAFGVVNTEYENVFMHWPTLYIERVTTTDTGYKPAVFTASYRVQTFGTNVRNIISTMFYNGDTDTYGWKVQGTTTSVVFTYGDASHNIQTITYVHGVNTNTTPTTFTLKYDGATLYLSVGNSLDVASWPITIGSYHTTYDEIAISTYWDETVSDYVILPDNHGGFWDRVIVLDHVASPYEEGIIQSYSMEITETCVTTQSLEGTIYSLDPNIKYRTLKMSPLIDFEVEDNFVHSTTISHTTPIAYSAGNITNFSVGTYYCITTDGIFSMTASDATRFNYLTGQVNYNCYIHALESGKVISAPIQVTDLTDL